MTQSSVSYRVLIKDVTVQYVSQTVQIIDNLLWPRFDLNKDELTCSDNVNFAVEILSVLTDQKTSSSQTQITFSLQLKWPLSWTEMTIVFYQNDRCMAKMVKHDMIPFYIIDTIAFRGKKSGELYFYIFKSDKIHECG